MSAWGAGIKQSDEFMDVYDEFGDLYLGDANPVDVANRILNEYLSEFDEKDILINTTYFALALCLWECGVSDAKITARVEEIIISGCDLELFEPDKNTIVHRRKVLDAFYDKLKSTPSKIRKPKKSTVKERMPTLHKGDLFAYDVDGGFRVAVTLDCIEKTFLLAVSETVYTTLPDKETILSSYTHTVFWSEQRAIIPKKERVIICKLDINVNYNNRAGFVYIPHSIFGCSSCGQREYFYNIECADETMKRNEIQRYTFEELLNPSCLPKYNNRIKNIE